MRPAVRPRGPSYDWLRGIAEPSRIVIVWDQGENTGLFGPIAAFLLGLIKRLIRRLDQVSGGSVTAWNRTSKARADGGDATVGVRDTEGFNSLSKCFRHLCRPVCTSAGQYDHEFVATVPRNQVSWPVDGARDRGGNLPKAPVA